MSEVYTYQELRELALKHGIRDNKVHIGVWIQTQGTHGPGRRYGRCGLHTGAACVGQRPV